MESPARKFIASIGGYQAVALAIGKKPTTVHTAMQAGVFPAAWFLALCDLAERAEVSAPDMTLFSFIGVVHPTVAA